MSDDANNPKPSNGFALQFASGRGYAIIDPSGRVVSGFNYDRGHHEDRLAELNAALNAKTKRGPRLCMRCREEFQSQGVHNRMCTRCRQFNDGGSMSIPALSAGQVRRAARH